MGGKRIKSKNRGHKSEKLKKKEKLVKIVWDSDAITKYIRRHRDNIDELLPWKSFSQTALHYVVNKQWMKGVQALVEAGANVNLFDTDYCYSPENNFRPCRQPFDTEYRATCTPLMRAARSQDLFDIAQYLLAHGADPHLKCPYTGESAVSVAVKHSNVDFVRLLIEKYNVEFDPSKVLAITCEWLFKYVNMSHEHDITKYIKLLLDKGAQMNSEFINITISRGWKAGVEVIVEAGADINQFHEEDHVMYTPLMRAARSPDLFDIAQYLLAHGADPHLKCPYTGESAVSVAFKHSNVDFVQLLIEKYNVEFDPSNLLNMTCDRLFKSVTLSHEHDITENIKSLLDKGAQMNSEYINIAISRGWKEGVEVIVGAGADINLFHEEDHIMYTPLMRAARSPDLFDIAQYLLAHGADPHLKCPNTGESAVSVAIKHSNADLVQLLIQKYNVKFDPTKALTMTWNVLCCSLKMSYQPDTADFIELLLGKGAQMELHYMHVAVVRGWLKLVEVFVKAGSDVNLFDTDSCYRPSRECVKCFNPAHRTSVSQSCSRSDQPFDRGLETRIRHTPLMIAAMSQDLFDITQYLLAHGADPHLKCPNTAESAVSVAIAHGNIYLSQLFIQKYNVQLDPTNVLTLICERLVSHSCKNEMYEYKPREGFKLLLKKGAQMGFHYKTVLEQVLPTQNISQDDLHSYFREGFNVNILCKYYIESKNEYCPNHIRWFLRHGLDTYAPFIPHCVDKALKSHDYGIVILLLHAGVDRFAITRWIKLPTFPCLLKEDRECMKQAYNEFQEDDLVEFSDVSLHIYPEVKELSADEIDRQNENMIMLASQPLTLKGLCRQCLRQSLCQPSPTVLMTLPIPRALKRYILCHGL